MIYGNREVEISYEFIKFQLQAQKINLKRECERYSEYGFTYRTIQNILAKEDDMKVSQLLFFCTILKCNVEDLLRTKY